jgi:hypothetical protein
MPHHATPWPRRRPCPPVHETALCARASERCIAVPSAWLRAQVRAAASTASDVGARVRAVRSQLEQDEQLAALMSGFRGSNLNADDFAREGQRMALVDVSMNGEEEVRQGSRGRWAGAAGG